MNVCLNSGLSMSLFMFRRLKSAKEKLRRLQDLVRMVQSGEDGEPDNMPANAELLSLALQRQPLLQEAQSAVRQRQLELAEELSISSAPDHVVPSTGAAGSRQ